MSRSLLLRLLFGWPAVPCGAVLSCATSAAPSAVVVPAIRQPAAGSSAEHRASAPAGIVLPVAANAGTCPEDSLLDDLEDADPRLHLADQRDGVWYTAKDDAGSSIEPEPEAPFQTATEGAEGSTQSARMHGRTGNSGAWVNIGFNLRADHGVVDLSCCKGIAFWGKKGKGTGAVRFKVGDVQTVPEGGLCQDCYNDFGVDLGFREEWFHFVLPFERMTQQAWGQLFEKLRTDKVYHLQWQVSNPRLDYDVFIDTVELVGCASEPLPTH